MIRKTLCLVVAVGCAAFSRTPELAVARPWSVTTSPIGLAYLFPNVGVEYRTTPDLGLALWAAFSTAEDPTQTASAQLRWYPRRSGAHALQLGAEAAFVRLDGSEAGYTNVEHYLTVGPFVGYRYDHASGFTWDIHAGPGLNWNRNTGHGWEAALGLLAGLNAGWSF